MDQGNMFNDVYDVIRRNFTLLIVITIIAGAAGALFSSSLFMKPRFKSSAAVYPINLTPHSEESETEQMLQIFASEEIKEAVLNEFQLWGRWELEPGEAEYRHWSNELYKERVSIGPTRYESVEIVCQDESPDTAKAMVEVVINTYNEVARRKDRIIHQKYLNLKEFEMQQLRLIIDSLETRMQTLRMNGGLLDFDSQAERVTEGYMDMLNSGASNTKLLQVKEMMAELAKDGSELEVLQEMVSELKVFFTELVEEKVQASAKANSFLDYVHVEVAPRMADKKTYPVRWVIVLLSVVLGLLASIIFLVLWDRVKK